MEKYFKIKILAIFIILLIINENTFAQLNGTYTINSTLGNFSGNPLGVSGKNYSSFTNAVAALTSYGVSGHVIFEVASNTYNEQISIPNIATASSSKTITFQSSSGNNADVTLQSPTAGANYVVEFNGCSFVGFRYMTLKNNHSTITWGKVFVLNTVLNNCNGILIENNKVISKNYSSYDANNIPVFHTAANGSYDVNNLKIRNNIIENGSVSIQLIGFSSAVRENTNIIENNNLTNFHEYGIYIENNDQLTISKNTIQSKGSNPGTDYGIYVKYSDNNSKIEKNKIIISGAAISSFGIYFSNSNVASSNPNIISNNIIAFTSGTGENKGIYATTIKYTQFLFNTVNIKSGSVSSYCFYPYAVTNSTDCKAEGNIFSNQVGGYAIKLQDPHNLASCNYNCLYSTGTNIGYFGFTDKTYAQWQALSLDLNSINILPTFVSNADLHLASEQVGLKIAPLNALVIDDIDNQARTGNPVYVGADEGFFAPLMPYMALSFNNSTIPLEHISVTDNAAINFTTAMSVEMWYKPNFIGNQKLIGKSDGLTRGWVMAVNGGNFEVETWDATGVTKSTFAGPIRVGNWYHLAFTWAKNGDLIMYINGFEASRVTAGIQNMGTTSNPLRIGIAPWDINQYAADGEMDEVRLWNVERTPAQIFENAHKRLIGNELGLVAYYDFDHTFGNSLINRQGNAVLNGLLNANFELPIDWVTSNAMVPYIVNVSNISSDGFTLDWLPVHNVTNFYYDLSSSPTFATFIQQNVSLPMGTTFSVTGLSLVEGQDYYIRMWCDVGVWTSPFTGKFQFKFQSPSGNHLNFDGIDDEVVLTSASGYSSIDTKITIEFWEYGLNSSNSKTTICQGLNSSGERMFVVHMPWDNGTIYFDAGRDGLGNDRIEKPASGNDWSGVWTHWAFTKNAVSGEMKIYRNGELWQSGSSLTKAFSGNIKKISIGANGSGAEFFKGKIDEFRVWNIERTQSDIQMDMYNLIDESHANYFNLIEYFRFDQGIPEGNNTSLPEELISYSNSCTPQIINGFQFNGIASNWNFSGKEGNPILTTTSVTNITGNTADINMKIFSVGKGTDATSEYGAVWSSSPCPTIANSIMITNNAFATGNYTKSISGLSPSTTYYVRAYAKNINGISYGETQTFSTTNLILCGNYTIDNSGTHPIDFPVGTNFQSFTAAVNALTTYEISCTVLFTVANGTYNEQIVIPQITGASATNTITFIAEYTQVPVLQFDASTTPAQNYVVKLDGADYLTFKNLKITNTSTDINYGRVIDLITPSSSITNVVFDGNIITSVLGSSNNDNYSGIRMFSGANTIDNITIQNNVFNGGNYSIFWENGSAYSPGNVIFNNQFIDYFSTGVYIQYQNDLLIQENIFDGKGFFASEGGIYLLDCNDNTRILSNKIECKPTNGGASNGIKIEYCYGSVGNKIEISNNMIIMSTGNNWNNGIYVGDCNYLDIINNSIKINSSGSWHSCLYLESAAINTILLNNIFVNLFNGYSLYFEDILAVTDCDYNILYSASGNVGSSDGIDYITLTDWTTNTGLDLNSFNENPPFVAPFLHINASIPTNVEGNALPIIGLTTDIDGNIRNATNPDIGADEGNFTPSTTPTAPVALTLISGFGEVAMQWDVSTDPNFDHYNIYVSQNLDLSLPVFTTTVSPNTTNQIFIPDLTSNVTYYFGVSVENDLGVESTTLIKNIKPLNSVIAGFGNSLSFDGVDDYMIIPDATSLNPGTGSFSIEFWAKIPANDKSAAIIEKVENGGDFTQYAIWVNGDNAIGPTDDADGHRRRICFNVIEDILGGPQRNCFTNRDIIDGKWHHIVCVADAANDNLQIFVDGLEEEVTFWNSGTWPNVINDWDLNIMSDNGTLPPEFQFSEGQIDEIRIWDYARTKKEIRRDINVPINGGAVGLMAYYRFDEGNYDNVWDFSGEENHGKLHNFPTWTFPGAPIRVITKKDYTKTGFLRGEDINGSSGVTFSIEIPFPAGTVIINDNQTGDAEYVRNFYGLDNLTYKVTSNEDSEFMTYDIQIIPFMKEKGHIDEFNLETNWVADTVKLIDYIYIGNDTTITILPDTYVQMQNEVVFRIQGRLVANANAANPITFAPRFPATGWKGISLNNTTATNDTTVFNFCIFNDVKFDGSGGAIYVDDVNKVKITNNQFNNCQVTHSGACIYAYNSIFTIKGNNFFNSYSNYDGAAIFLDQSDVTIANNSFISNIANDNGGAIFMDNSSPLILNNVFNGNTATNNGGAIVMQFSNPQIYNNLFVHNSATRGGAIAYYQTGGKFFNNTLFQNTAAIGGAINLNSNSNTVIKNSIFYGNVASFGRQINIETSNCSPDLTYNNIQLGFVGINDEEGGGFWGNYNNNIDLPPLFIDTGLDDYTLQSTSPCINAGDPLTDITDFNTDLAGNQRIKFCYIDIGCYEAQSLVFAGYDNVWLGCVDDNWHEADNWSSLTVPDASDDVLIPGNTPFQPRIYHDSVIYNVTNENAECFTITINISDNALLTIEQDGILKVNKP